MKVHHPNLRFFDKSKLYRLWLYSDRPSFNKFILHNSKYRYIKDCMKNTIIHLPSKTMQFISDHPDNLEEISNKGRHTMNYIIADDFYDYCFADSDEYETDS